jgi:hypothetical protein
MALRHRRPPPSILSSPSEAILDNTLGIVKQVRFQGEGCLQLHILYLPAFRNATATPTSTIAEPTITRGVTGSDMKTVPTATAITGVA